MLHFSMKKLLRESELNESASRCLSVGLLLSEAPGIITYERLSVIDGSGMETRATTLL